MDTLFYIVQQPSGPDEFGGQYCQASRNNDYRRPRQYDHGDSGSQDREADHNYDQTFGLAKRSEDMMFHRYSPEMDADINTVTRA